AVLLRLPPLLVETILLYRTGRRQAFLLWRIHFPRGIEPLRAAARARAVFGHRCTSFILSKQGYTLSIKDSTKRLLRQGFASYRQYMAYI
ncbi:MAG: hypothetical protein MRZ54_00285, partial [Clostridiales bacterium]|nr:hypothetical protein [Clostridiales bacterium]